MWIFSKYSYVRNLRPKQVHLGFISGPRGLINYLFSVSFHHIFFMIHICGNLYQQSIFTNKVALMQPAAEFQQQKVALLQTTMWHTEGSGTSGQDGLVTNEVWDFTSMGLSSSIFSLSSYMSLEAKGARPNVHSVIHQKHFKNKIIR